MHRSLEALWNPLDGRAGYGLLGRLIIIMSKRQYTLSLYIGV